jgi:hypothetical protein
MFSAYGVINITKTCSLGPCGLGQLHGNDDEDDECEREKNRDSYECTVCCRTPECNAAQVTQLAHSLLHTLLLYQLIGRAFC